MSIYTYGSKIKTSSVEYQNDTVEATQLTSIVHEPYIQLTANTIPKSLDTLGGKFASIDFTFGSNTSSIYDVVVFPSSIESQTTELTSVFAILTSSFEFINSSDASGTLNVSPIFVEWAGNIVKYEITANEPSSPTIVQSADITGLRLPTADYIKSSEKVSTTTDDSLLTKRLPVSEDSYGDQGFGDRVPIMYGYIESIDVFLRGEGIPLGSTVTLEKNEDIDSSEFTDAVVSCEFGIDDNTIQISGGFDYEEGDTFTVSDGTASVDGVIIVEEVDILGGIVSIAVSNYGKGFITTPTVTYNGTYGNNASITFSDTYSITGLTLDTPGTPYKHGAVRLLVDGEYYNAEAKVSISNGGKYPVINDDSLSLKGIIPRKLDVGGYDGTTSVSIVNSLSESVKDSSFISVSYT